ncbi:hypothetical protein MJ1_0532 [Nanobdella aerobiophila]|uniref:Uncharacterized protein n=1 Tax=Nanobdella aerobiophila TaxID=2586965 RepID=A0A915WSV2_9ARCH|nr:hypothetical protein [Nanobdella aerobiophila]BBL45685.1 hypothetical protein MJ1_0532 [Nanobdella aerobiophila]
MDINKIPKTIMLSAIAVFVILVLFIIYYYYVLSYIPPYLKYMSPNCQYADNQSVVIVTAKSNLYNVTVYNFLNTSSCSIGNILSGSMGGCQLNNSPIDSESLVRILYSVNQEQYQVIISCKQINQNSIVSYLNHLI